MKVVFSKDTWFVGKRGFRERYDESYNCHHFKVLEGSTVFEPYIGKEIAVYLNTPLFFVLNIKESDNG